MTTTPEYFVRDGKRYTSVGHETPRFLSDGIWLVQDRGCKQQRILKIGELKNPYPYAQMAKDGDLFASYLGARFSQYFSDALKINKDGTICYSLPCTGEIAKDLLKFLARTNKEKQCEIKIAVKAASHVDSTGHVVDGNGQVVHLRHTKEATAYKIKELKRQLAEAEQLFGEQCINEL